MGEIQSVTDLLPGDFIELEGDPLGFWNFTVMRGIVVDIETLGTSHRAVVLIEEKLWSLVSLESRVVGNRPYWKLYDAMSITQAHEIVDPFGVVLLFRM